MITKLRSGRVTRRTFLERILALGLSSTSALSLLEGCGSSSSDSTVYLLWQSEYDPSNAYPQLVEDFNERNQGRIHVSMQLGPNGTNDLARIERNILKAHSAAVDIFSVDIVYMAEFAQQRWLQPISESRWPQREREKYLEKPLQACTFDGQLWAVPFKSDVGLIYYRTDFISTPPTTWEELTSMAQTILAQKDHPQYGYAWQGAQYEGLVCNFDEVLHGYGGSLFFDPLSPTVVTVDSPEARQALTTMVDWIGTISPSNTDTYTEEVTRTLWESGEVLFMRNWSYAYNTQSQVLADHFAIHPLLSGGNNHMGRSSLGGWQLAINAFIDPAKQDAAWEFIQYMLQPEAQRIGATMGSWTMTLQSIYEDQEVLSKVPFYKQLKPILQAAVPRPVAPNYIDISTAILFHVRQALTRQVSVQDAVEGLASDLRRLTSTNQAT
jgi:multiple sugar transport system substrate-binding protein